MVYDDLNVVPHALDLCIPGRGGGFSVYRSTLPLWCPKPVCVTVLRASLSPNLKAAPWVLQQSSTPWQAANISDEHV